MAQNNYTLITQQRRPKEEEELWENSTNVLYGPVASRRLGESLGINLFPTIKVCSYNCVYCDVGITKYKNGIYMQSDKLLKLFNEQLIPIKKKLNDGKIKIDYFTFCGNGENLDHPEFAEIYYFIKNILENEFTGIPVAILTNGVNLSNKQNLEIINSIDINFIKLDAGDKKTYLRIDRPRNKNTWNNLVKNLELVRNLRIETAVVDSVNYSNLTSLRSSYIDLINKYEKIGNLKGLYLHNIDYPTNDKSIKYFTEGEMMEIGAYISQRTDVPIYLLHSLVNFRNIEKNA